MDTPNWIEILGWGKNQLEEVQFTGFNFLREGKYLEAIVFFEALSVLEPQKVYYWQTLGALYLQTSQLPKALETLNKALTITSSHEPTLLNKVKTLLLLHQNQEALAIARLLEKSEDSVIASEAGALIMSYSRPQ